MALYQFMPQIAISYLLNFLHIVKVNKVYRPTKGFKATTGNKLAITLTTVFISTFGIYDGAIEIQTRKIDIGYNEKISTCIRKYKMSEIGVFFRIFDQIKLFLTLILPCLGILITTTLLICVAIKMLKRRTNIRGIMCYIVLTVLFIVSTLPWYVYLGGINDDIPTILLIFCFVKDFGNFFVFYFTNYAFKSFVHGNLRKVKDLTGLSSMGVSMNNQNH